MRRRFTVLGVLVAFLAPSFLVSAPAPAPRQYPAVYALVYVGKGKNERANVLRVEEGVNTISGLARMLWNDPEIQKLAVAKEKKPDEFLAWMTAGMRVRTLENTSVIRVWFAAGTPEEQVIIINTILRAYLRDLEKTRQNIQRDLEQKRQQAKKKGEEALRNMEAQLQTDKENYHNLPRLLEWAAVPGQR